MSTFIKAALFAGISSFAVAASAQELKLKSIDGFLTFEGDLVAFDGDMLTLDTSFGTINIPALSVVCVGGPCPDGVTALIASPEETATEAPSPTEPVLTTTLDVSDTAEPVEPIVVEPAGDIEIAFQGETAQRIFNQILTAGAASTGLGLTVSVETDGFSVAPEAGGDATIVRPGSPLTAHVFLQSERPTEFSPRQYNVPSDWAARNGAAVYELGNNPLAVVTSDGAGVDAVTVEQLAGIFSGRIRNWSEIGGNDVPVMPIQVAGDQVAQDSVNAAILHPYGLEPSDGLMKAPSESLALQTLAIAPGAITVVSPTSLGSALPVSILDSCAIPVQPTPFDIASGRYPLTVSTYASLDDRAAASPVGTLVQALAARSRALGSFEDEILSDGNESARRLQGVLAGVVPEGYVEPAKSMIENIFQASRLSLTIKGGPLPEADAARNRSDFARLERAILDGRFDGQDVMFIGYSLEGSNPANSISQSRRSANALLAAFRRFAPEAANRPGVSFVSDGYGIVGHHDCTARGDQAPDFVEIWVRPT